MPLNELLAKKKDSLVDKWFEDAVATYPAQSAEFLRRKKDRFGNPVGSTIARELSEIFDQLAAGLEREKLEPCLDRIVRIRALQDINPVQALGFIFSLKHAVREELGQEIAKQGLEDELWALDNQIDALALIAFEIYMRCREQIYAIKTDEVKRMYYQVLRRADIFCEVPTQEQPDLKKEDGNHESQ